MNRKAKTVILFVIILGLVITAGITYRIHKRNVFITTYIREHKEELYKLALNNGTNIQFMGYYKDKNKSVIDGRLNDLYQTTYDNLILNISYDIGDEDKVGLKDFIDIQDTTLNGLSYDDFDFEPQYIMEFNANNQNKIQLDFIIKLDIEELNAVVVPIIHNKVDIRMIGAQGKISNGTMQITNTGSQGRTFNETKVTEQLNALETIKFSELDENYNVSLMVESEAIKIYPTSEDLLDITSKVSSFSTGYSSSSSSRKTNIAIAAKHLNGKIILPDESISIDKAIKSRNAANGYAKAGSYLNGKTVQTYGGGVCQVSTTLYGAVLRAGIVPTERNAHSMSVSYVPMGLDAAISEGYKDLKIKNTYSTPIYIEAITNGSTLTFNIYGKAGLLDGYSYEPKSKANGLKATAWLNKIKDGQVVEQISLNSSSYRPHS